MAKVSLKQKIIPGFQSLPLWTLIVLQWSRADRGQVWLLLSYIPTASSQYDGIVFAQFLVLGKTGGKTEKQKSLCDEVISQNCLLFMEEKPSWVCHMLPEGQPSAEDWFILSATGVHVNALLPHLSCTEKQLCSCLVPASCFCP